jgi:hypothetical protein
MPKTNAWLIHSSCGQKVIINDIANQGNTFTIYSKDYKTSGDYTVTKIEELSSSNPMSNIDYYSSDGF